MVADLVHYFWVKSYNSIPRSGWVVKIMVPVDAMSVNWQVGQFSPLDPSRLKRAVG